MMSVKQPISAAVVAKVAAVRLIPAAAMLAVKTAVLK